MTAFVTRGGGFIGRHLVRRLRDGGTELRAIARSVSRIGPDLSELIRSSASVTYWATDAKARRELGYAPRDLEAGLVATFGGTP